MKAAHIVLAFALLLPILAPAADAASEPPRHGCGTGGPEQLSIAIATHDLSLRRNLREKRSGRARQIGDLHAEGQLAVLDDDTSVVLPPNVFDLQGAEMQYLRRPRGMSTVRVIIGYRDVIGDKIDIGDDDSIEFVFADGFRFPFGNQVYDRVWVNSDGNLTFGEGDNSSFARDLNRFLQGPPRIAPLFTDLDPTQAQGEDGVYVAQIPNRFRVTWVNVPEFGESNSSTVQMTLFSTGRITFVYGDTVEAQTAIVGVNAFTNGEIHLMDYDVELPFTPPQKVAIAEQFSDAARIDEFGAVARFMGAYRDLYDTVIIWTDFESDLEREGGAIAWHITLKNDVLGIHEDIFDVSFFLGGEGRLSGMAMMGHLGKYSTDPEENTFRNGESAMDLLAHEFGHRWMAHVHFIDTNGGSSGRLLDSSNEATAAHWSAYMHSMGSFLEGNFIEENANGTFRTTRGFSAKYSTLDQYLMGLRSAQAVEDFFYVSGTQSFSRASAPRGSQLLTGTRVDVTVDDIIAAEGPRRPAFGQSRKDFRTGFLLVGEPGRPVSQQSIDHLETFRQRWITYFQESTDNRGTVSTGLFPR